MTIEGPDPDRPCIFPFFYRDLGDDSPATGDDSNDFLRGWSRYDKCALDFDGKAWCPTEIAEDKHRRIYFGNRGGYNNKSSDESRNRKQLWNKWGHCSPNCPITAGPGGKLKHILPHLT